MVKVRARGSAPRWDSQAGQPVSSPPRVGVSLGGGASRGREVWLGCQVPLPFVRLLSCCLGQSPEQPPPERAELSSLPAPAPSRPNPDPTRPGPAPRSGTSDRGTYVSLWAEKGQSAAEVGSRRLRAGEGGC